METSVLKLLYLIQTLCLCSAANRPLEEITIMTRFNNSLASLSIRCTLLD